MQYLWANLPSGQHGALLHSLRQQEVDGEVDTEGSTKIAGSRSVLGLGDSAAPRHTNTLNVINFLLTLLPTLLQYLKLMSYSLL